MTKETKLDPLAEFKPDLVDIYTSQQENSSSDTVSYIKVNPIDPGAFQFFKKCFRHWADQFGLHLYSYHFNEVDDSSFLAEVFVDNLSRNVNIKFSTDWSFYKGLHKHELYEKIHDAAVHEVLEVLLSDIRLINSDDHITADQMNRMDSEAHRIIHTLERVFKEDFFDTFNALYNKHVL